MLDTSGSLETAASELGCEVEQLLTPLTCRRIQAPGKRFAVDNGAFSQLEIKGFLSLLKRLEPEKHLVNAQLQIIVRLADLERLLPWAVPAHFGAR